VAEKPQTCATAAAPGQAHARERIIRRVSSWNLAVGAGIVLAYATLSRRLDRTVVTGAIFFVTAGLVTGSDALGWIDLEISGEQVRVLAEVTLTLVLFADASRIDFGALRREYAVPVRLLGIGLPLTILLGWAIGAALLPDFQWTEALVLAIVLAPTDAALGEAVVTDSRLPSRIRQGLNVESGLNDGICVPLLFIALGLAEADEGALTARGAVRIVVEEIGYGVMGGLIAGVVGALLVETATRNGLARRAWIQVLPVGAAALAYGLAAPLGGSGFIAAFVAGLVFGSLRSGADRELTYLLDELGGLTSAVTFVVFGAAIVLPVLGDLSWAAAAYAALSLTVVRMLPVAVSLVGLRPRPPTVAFLGWFGPRGLASIVFMVIVVEGSDLTHAGTIVVAVVATIVLSVYAHGITAQLLTDRYVRWYERHPEDMRPEMESVPAAHQHWRAPLGTSGSGGT
jgi:NhaP-type Na+/H+ or K+/H+ antiporter